MKNTQQGSPDFNYDELKSIAPTLAKLRKDLHTVDAGNPFSAPEGYFDSLNSDVMKKIESLPGVESVSNENPFKVPENYFEILPSVIQQKIIDRKAKKISIA